MSMQMFSCPRCRAEFDTFKSLEYHLRAAHTEAVASHPFRCVTCDAEFMEPAKWLDHLRDEHGDGARGAAPRDDRPRREGRR